MLTICDSDDLFKDLRHLNGTKLLLAISHNELSFEVTGKDEITTIKYPHPVEWMDIAVEYDHDDFRSLLRLVKKMNRKVLYLGKDFNIYLSEDGSVSFFIKPMEKRIGAKAVPER